MTTLPQDDDAYQLWCDEQDERYKELLDQEAWEQAYLDMEEEEDE